MAERHALVHDEEALGSRLRAKPRNELPFVEAVADEGDLLPSFFLQKVQHHIQGRGASGGRQDLHVKSRPRGHHVRLRAPL